MGSTATARSSKRTTSLLSPRSDATDASRESAAAFLRRHQKEIRDQVSRWTGEYRFTLDQVLKQMIGRCRELKLRLTGSEARVKQDFAIVLTMHTMRCLHRGGSWHAL